MPKKILVVDDEPDILRVEVFRLKQTGCEIVTAVTGAEAIERARSARPDLVVVDLRLPDMTGIDVARSIREDEAMKAVPILLVTASSGEDVQGLLEGTGINDFVMKPFKPEDFIAKVKKYLGQEGA